MAPRVSASGTRGFGQWISSRSITSRRNLARLSLTERSRSCGASSVGCTLVVTMTSDLSFIVVHLRRIDMPVADADRLFGQPRAVASSQGPGAKADNRDAETFGLDRRSKFARRRTH